MSDHIIPRWDTNTVTFDGLERFWENPDTTIEDICKIFPSWGLESVTMGLNYLYDRFASDTAACFNIWSNEEIEQNPALADVVLFFFPHSASAHNIILCPGGGYEAVCSIAEGFPAAKHLHDLGFNVFVLKYRTYPNAEYLNPQEDLARAVQYMIKNASILDINPEQYSVCGFSAGGHLAASWGTQNMGYRKFDLPSPNSLILAYPVITMRSKAHAGSRWALLGDNPSQERIDFASVEKQISFSYPPAFIWHGTGDASVDYVGNSIALANSLSLNEVKHHVLSVKLDEHGVGVGIGTAAEGWLEKAVTFLRSVSQ